MPSLLRPLFWIIWASRQRRARKLMQFAEVEAGGGRDLVRAAERTDDPLLRRLFFAHARDEARHAGMFRARALELGADASDGSGSGLIDWIAPGERSIDDPGLVELSSGPLLAFIHLSEKTASRDFAEYSAVLGRDPRTCDLFRRILHDEEGHMRYSLDQLKRVAPEGSAALLWRARLRRLWRAYLRLASTLAGAISTVLLTIQYFVLLPPFALLAKRAMRREPAGWTPVSKPESAQ